MCPLVPSTVMSRAVWLAGPVNEVVTPEERSDQKLTSQLLPSAALTVGVVRTVPVVVDRTEACAETAWVALAPR